MNVPFDKFIAFQCPKCGQWQGKQNNKWCDGMNDAAKLYAIKKLTLKCKHCNKTTKFKPEGFSTPIRHVWCKTAQQLMQIVKQKNDPNTG